MLKDAHILFDTCILNHLLGKQTELVGKTNSLLNELLENGNSFYISDFTKYELLRSISEDKKLKCENLLKKLIHIEHVGYRIDRSIQLYSLYKKHPKIQSHLSSISDVDIIIGSLLFTNQNTYLLTADYSDFPRPFFKEKDIWRIEYSKGRGNKASIYYYLLEANLEEFR